MPPDHGRYVDGVRFVRFNHWDNFELLQYSSNLWRVIRLECAYNHILAALSPAAAFVQHLEGFADAAGVAQEHLQPPALGSPFFQLNLR
jgi:hypothetical protein